LLGGIPIVVEDILLGMPGIGGIPMELLDIPTEPVDMPMELLDMPGIGGILAEPVFIGGALGADIYI
jgi:hypothetical protein